MILRKVRVSAKYKFTLLLSLISFLWMLIVLLLIESSWGTELRERAIAPLEFKLRSAWGREPKISPQLKVIVYDDVAKNAFGIQELITIQQWQEFIEAIATRAPRAILFDKFFSFTNDDDHAIENFNKSLTRLNMPVIAATAFGLTAAPSGSYDLSQFANWEVADLTRLEKGSMQNLIGPEVRIRRAFKKIGGIGIQSISSMQPAWLESSTGAIVPQLSLSFTQQVKWQKEKIEIENSDLYLDKSNRIPVNFIQRQSAIEHFLPARPIFRLGSASAVVQKIQRGDTVLVLPSMYSGSMDFKNSPIGRIEGGLYHMSLINSVLMNQSLRPVFQSLADNIALFLLLALLSFLCVFRFTFLSSVTIIVVSAVIIILCGIFGFVYFSQISDWHLYSTFLLLNGGALLAVRAARDERQSQRIETALQGMVAPALLEALKRKPEALYRRPKERTISVMFVDIEGFSLRTQELPSAEVFKILQTQIESISHIIHAHGGVVDRILGDGLMAFFGFSFEEQNANIAMQNDYVERAVRCAIEIQRNATHLTASAQNPRVELNAIIPLRIGISTGDAFLGNLGSGNRIDFTVIGHTVNMAKRFEDACETFRVFMSPETYKHLKDKNLLVQFSDAALRLRLMSLKHHSELFEGWECDPFFSQPELLSKAQNNIKKDSIIKEQSSQNKLSREIRLLINEKTEGMLIGIHHDRLTIVTGDYYCRKIFLSTELLPNLRNVDEQLVAEHLKILYLQVISGSPTEDGRYEHTLALLHLPPNRMTRLNQILLGDAS